MSASAPLLTGEQAEIVGIDVRPGQTMKINALAGTGKTTTLTAYADARPTQRFLYLAFNATAANDAKGRFPSNTTCRTVHSLAYAKTGSQYQAKLAKGNIRPNVIQDLLGGRLARKDAQRIMATVAKYLNSADVIIRGSHIPEDDKVWDHVGTAYTTQELSPADRQINTARIRSTVEEEGMSYPEAALKVLDDLDMLSQRVEEELYRMIQGQRETLEQANTVWDAMQDVTDMRMPITHDGYLKLFQLSNPKLSYDGIFLDEGQDTNPVTLAIFDNQKICSKIIVGDRYQSIYQFRGATNAMAKVKSNLDLYLTTSFRFGPAIAAVANLILKDFHQEEKLLKGLKQSGGVGYIDKSKPYTVIARTNGTLFKEAVTTIESARAKGKALSVGFVATTEADGFSPTKPYGLDLLTDIYHLWRNQKNMIKDAYIGRFDSFQELLKHATNPASPDPELASKARLVEEYKESLLEKIQLVVSSSVDPKSANILFTSAHRSKGLEWSQVVLADDFIDLVENEIISDPTTPLKAIDVNPENEQELNLLYVASTRAKSVLQTNAQIRAYEQMISERGVRQEQHAPSQNQTRPEATPRVRAEDNIVTAAQAMGNVDKYLGTPANEPVEQAPHPTILSLKTDRDQMGKEGVVYIGQPHNQPNQHFGVPYIIQVEGKTPEGRQRLYKEWLEGSNYTDKEPERRKWIMDNLQKIREAKALMGITDAKESHAHVLIEKAFELEQAPVRAVPSPVVHPTKQAQAPDANVSPEDTVIPFGAHRGKMLGDLDDKYLYWLVNPVIGGDGKKYNVPKHISDAAAILVNKLEKGIGFDAPKNQAPTGDPLAEAESERMHLQNNFVVEPDIEETQKEEIELSNKKANDVLADLFSQ